MSTKVNSVKKDGICRVIVHNINNVPSVERFRGLPDPYVNVFYHGTFIIWFSFSFDIFVKNKFVFCLLGIKKQTSWQRSTCDPKWDETLDFPLNDVPIQSTDVLEIHLKDHETIGANK